MSDQTTNERKSTRYRFIHVLPVFDRESGDRLGHVGDASAEGLLLVGNAEIPKGGWRRLRVEIPLEDGGTDDVMLDGESRWCQHVSEPDDWLTGFNIAASPLHSRMYLASLIHEGF